MWDDVKWCNNIILIKHKGSWPNNVLCVQLDILLSRLMGYINDILRQIKVAFQALMSVCYTNF